MSQHRLASGIEPLLAWMQGVVTHPYGVRASDDVKLRETVTRSRRLSEAERLAIYSTGYHARLMLCFEAEYPCLHHALGDELFAAFARRYLDQYPPVSYTLFDLSDRFDQFLEETRPDADKAPEARESWPDFIIELARLERVFLTTFNGMGPEQGEILTSADLPDSDEVLGELRLKPIESLSVHEFRYPVVEFFKAARIGGEPELPEADSNFLAINRRDYAVRFHQMKESQFRFLSALVVDRMSVGEAIRKCGVSKANQPRGWLESWADDQYFRKS